MLILLMRFGGVAYVKDMRSYPPVRYHLSLWSLHILEKISHYIEKQGTMFCFRNLEFNTIYNAFSNKSPFKYHISILGGCGSEAMLI